MKHWTKEDKAIVAAIITDVEDWFGCHIEVIEKEGGDIDTDEGCAMFREELSFLKELSGMIAKDIKGDPVHFELGQQYECLQRIDYDGVKKEMFTKGNVYVVIRDRYGRVGLMSNDGVVRSERDIPDELNSEYFRLVGE